MKKLILGAMAAGVMLLPLTQAEAYHIIKQHQDDAVVSARPVAEENKAGNPGVTVQDNSSKDHKEPQLVDYNSKKTVAQPAVSDDRGFSATATARTDRSLISNSARASVIEGDTKTVEAQSPLQPYKMRGGDVLQIFVYGHPEISTNPTNNTDYFKVRPAGGLSFPLIGEVYCYGRTVADVTNEVTQRLSEYIVDPKVSINISKWGTIRVNVLGQIAKQGSYELQKDHYLVDALAAAGGFSEKSAKKCVYVVRRGMNNFVTKVNVLETLTKGNQACNPELQEGDIVYLSSNHKFTLASILGITYNIINAWDSADEIRKRN